MTSPTMYYYTQVMNNLFKEYEKVEQISDFWNVSVNVKFCAILVFYLYSFQFLEEDMLDGLYWEYLYNDGSDKRFICPGGEEAVGPCPVAPADRNILYENRLLGLPRLVLYDATAQKCRF